VGSGKTKNLFGERQGRLGVELGSVREFQFIELRAHGMGDPLIAMPNEANDGAGMKIKVLVAA
jgi:hypothetical protein